MVCIMLISMTTSVLASPSAKAFDNRVIQRISIKRMMENLNYLVNDIGVRVASTPEEYETAQFIAKKFESYGYEDVEIQPFEYRNRVAYVNMIEPEEKKIDVRIGGNRNNAVLTSPEGVTGQVIYCGMGGIDDFPAEVNGNIALVKRGQEAFADMVNRAEDAGAVGVIIQNNEWRIFSVNVPSATIPYVTLNEETGELLRGENIVVNLKTEEYDTSWNVIATRRPKNKNRDSGNIVTFSAHYDTVPTAPGASDNGTGVVGLLELARIYSNMPVDTELRFIACGAEEVGLVGSSYYVSQMSEEEIGRTVANYNMDMIGTAGPDQTHLYVGVQTGTSENPEHNLVSFTAKEAAKRLGYANLVLTPVYRGSSDHVSFARAGIAAGSFIYRDPETAALEPWYHQPYDTIDRISEERLLMAIEIVAAASHDVVRYETPNLINSMIRQGVERPLIKDYQYSEPDNFETLSGNDK